MVHSLEVKRQFNETEVFSTRSEWNWTNVGQSLWSDLVVKEGIMNTYPTSTINIT